MALAFALTISADPSITASVVKAPSSSIRRNAKLGESAGTRPAKTGASKCKDVIAVLLVASVRWDKDVTKKLWSYDRQKSTKKEYQGPMNSGAI